jgi:hypothetical protein
VPLPIPTIVKKDLVVVSLADQMPNVEPKFLEAIKLKQFVYATQVTLVTQIQTKVAMITLWVQIG